jgi:hypothetical protein
MTEEQRNQFVERGAEWAASVSAKHELNPVSTFRITIDGAWTVGRHFKNSGLGPFEEGPARNAFTEGARAVFKVMGVV